MSIEQLPHEWLFRTHFLKGILANLKTKRQKI